MKNIHLIPTDKPSRLVRHNPTGKIEILPGYIRTNPAYTTQNIYITSDEEIKDIRPHKGKWHLEKEQILNKFPSYLTDLSECKLVIMTTDQNLINDGVQDIDYEFLKWFVNNQSCEMIEIIIEYKDGYGNWFKYDKEFWDKQGNQPKFGTRYKIIITKEETKQENFEYVSIGEERIKLTIQEQETIEEAAERYAEDFDLSFYSTAEEIPVKEFAKRDFIEGAKFQSKRMYSEKEMLAIIAEIFHTPKLRDGGWEDIFEWFEQFKNKNNGKS